MTFNPRSLVNAQALSVAGGVLIGAGLFTFVAAGFEHLVQPMFNIVFENGRVSLSHRNNISLGCGAFLAGVLIAAVSVAIGLALGRAAAPKGDTPAQ